MTEIRDYLRQVDRHSLLRSGGTHPAIVTLVRAFEAGGGTYDEDAERYVEAACGDLPPHQYHGHPERDPMTYTLGAAIYNARKVLADERNEAQLSALRAEGYQSVAEAAITEGKRYLLRFGTLYAGRTRPTYSAEVRVRAARVGDRTVLMPYRSRSREIVPTDTTLIKQVPE